MRDPPHDDGPEEDEFARRNVARGKRVSNLPYVFSKDTRERSPRMSVLSSKSIGKKHNGGKNITVTLSFTGPQVLAINLKNVRNKLSAS